MTILESDLTLWRSFFHRLFQIRGLKTKVTREKKNFEKILEYFDVAKFIVLQEQKFFLREKRAFRSVC